MLRRSPVGGEQKLSTVSLLWVIAALDCVVSLKSPAAPVPKCLPIKKTTFGIDKYLVRFEMAGNATAEVRSSRQ